MRWLDGTVTGFDESQGLGEIESGSTGERFPFHATQLADGTRWIEIGAPVQFEVSAGGLGRYEAIRIRVVSTTASETFRCPVCSLEILGRPRTYEICESCGWEDDPGQFEDPTSTGANIETLNDARVAWKQRELRRDT